MEIRLVDSVTPRVALRSTLGYLMMPPWGSAFESLLYQFRWLKYSPRYRCLGEISNSKTLNAILHVEDST